MGNDVWALIMERINKEHPYYGELKIDLFYHDNRLVKFTITKTDTILIRENDK